MRTLAIDAGTKRVGLAICDDGGKFSNPLEVMQVSSLDAALEQVARVARVESAERLLVGVPINMDDSMSAMGRSIVDWSKKLATLTKLPVVYVDERLSSFEAELQLDERRRAGERITKGGRKKRLDALVAANLLQAFLDGKLAAIDPARVPD